MAAGPTDIDIALEELESRLERLRSLYEQYFIGIEKIEPSISRQDVDRRIHALRGVQIRNTAKRYKLQHIIQRYNTFQQYWLRICREIENGTYHRHLARAQNRFGDVPLTAAAKRRARLHAAAEQPKPEQKERAKRAAEDDLEALLREDPEAALERALREAEAVEAPPPRATPGPDAPAPPDASPELPEAAAAPITGGGARSSSMRGVKAGAADVTADAVRAAAPQREPERGAPDAPTSLVRELIDATKPTSGARPPPPPRRRGAADPAAPEKASTTAAKPIEPGSAAEPPLSSPARAAPLAASAAASPVRPAAPREDASKRMAAEKAREPLAVPEAAAAGRSGPAPKLAGAARVSGEIPIKYAEAGQVPAPAPAPERAHKAAARAPASPIGAAAPSGPVNESDEARSKDAPAVGVPRRPPAKKTEVAASQGWAALREPPPPAVTPSMPKTTRSGSIPAAATSSAAPAAPVKPTTPKVSGAAPAKPLFGMPAQTRADGSGAEPKSDTAAAARSRLGRGNFPRPSAAGRDNPASTQGGGSSAEAPGSAVVAAQPLASPTPPAQPAAAPAVAPGAAGSASTSAAAAEARAATAAARESAARAGEARARSQADAGKAAASGLDEQRLTQLHQALVAERRRLNQPGKVSMEALASSLRETESKLRKQYADKPIDFRVVVKDGKAVVKPVVG